MPPKAAICAVFGDYCQEAVAVAWCESRLRPTAQNGQYLGLFQMGSYERQLFGHGSVRARAGGRRSPLLRALRPRLEPVELPLGRRLSSRFCRKLRHRVFARGYRADAPFW